MKGKVWLVGAGPGDSGLLTLKGKRVLEQADAVVYDRLIGGVLSWIPQNAARIYVGKTSGHHTVPQEQTNKILLELALQGKRVVRLKGGDPFLFGRGGEELALLQEHDIPFEVVPGVTSAISVPAYNGIPVTHRDLSSSLHIFTAHQKKNLPLALDFSAIAKLEGTLAFLMGVSALKEICSGLIAAGKDPETPAAMLENGTLACQRRVAASLRELPEKAEAAGIHTPAVLIVGAVCALAEQFHWAEDRPLGSAKVLVTRSREKAGVLSERLESLGAEVYRIPSIALEPCSSNAVWDTLNPTDYDWMVFSSPAAAEHFFRLLRQSHRDVRSFSGIQIAAVGKATAAALEARGMFADLIPATYDGTAMAKALCDRLQDDASVLVFQSESEASSAADFLEQRKVKVQRCPLYRTVYATDPVELPSDAIAVFTSAATVRAFRLRTEGQCLQGYPAVCIGEKTAAQARAYEMNVTVAEEATIDSLVQAVCKCHETRRKTT